MFLTTNDLSLSKWTTTNDLSLSKWTAKHAKAKLLISPNRGDQALRGAKYGARLRREFQSTPGEFPSPGPW